MLPGFFRRLRTELLSTLAASHPTPPSPPVSPTKRDRSARHHQLASRLSVLRATPHFAPLTALARSLAITNDPSHASGLPANPLHPKSGTAPAFSPALLPWIGGSLAGALKTGGDEILREKWEESLEDAKTEVSEGADDAEPPAKVFALPDWTLMRLRVV